MKEIKCPHCKKVFSVDESEYAELLSQVRTDSFNEELNRRIAEMRETKEAERKAALAEMSRTSEKELADAKNRDIDVTRFEEKLENFKGIFGKHVKDAAARYNDALVDIDKAIKELQDMKEHLRLWVDHLYKAENNFDDISIRKLTYKNPTMKAMFEEAHAADEIEEIK